jgi:hypothetical protein
MSAETLDPEQLRPLITKQEQAQRTAALAMVGVLQDLRAILTPQQRAKAADVLNKTPPAPPQPSPTSKPSPTAQEQALALTAEQQPLFNALLPPKPEDPLEVPKAMATLLTSGDATDLTAALTPARSLEDQVDAVLTALASLTRTQRLAMFANDEDS